MTTADLAPSGPDEGFAGLDVVGNYDSGVDLLRGFYIPVLKQARRYDRVAGYFFSSSFVSAAAGISRFIAGGGQMRMLVGAQLTVSDQEALTGAVSLDEVLANRLEIGDDLSSDEVARNRLQVIAWLIREGRLQIRVGVPCDDDGVPLAGNIGYDRYFHSKFGILTDEMGEQVVFSGTINESAAGWQKNFENFSVYQSSQPTEVWNAYAQPLVDRFEELWRGSRVGGFKTVELPTAIKDRLLAQIPDDEDWIPPEGLEVDLAVLGEYFGLRRNAYQTAPANESILDELHNRREEFAISSYFEVPTTPSDVLQEWALPPNLRGNVHLDTVRGDIVDRVVSAPPEQNFVIIGEPGVGKTVLLFEMLDRLITSSPVGVITTPALGDAHLAFGMRLLYDDIPENMGLVEAITTRRSQGIIVTAREVDWQALPESFQALFDRLTVPLFTNEEMAPLCRSMLGFSGLGHDKTAVKLLVDFAEGSPIYVWSLIRELMHSGIRTLSKTYIREHATKGMANYVSMLLQRLLKDGKEFRPGGLHSLTCMVFLTEYLDERQCHDLYFRTAAEVLAEHTEKEFNDSLHMVTFNHVMAYLSGEGAVVRFPHDTWVDVLRGAGSLNPFRAEIQTIHSAFEDTGIFKEIMRETVVETWATLAARYHRNQARNRDSFLALADTLLRNFTLGDLQKLEVDIGLMREVASAHSHLPLAAMLVSKLQAAQPSQVTNVINIQDSVISRSNVG